MELNLEAMVREAANNLGTLNTRCMMLAGELEALRAKLAALEKANQEPPKE